MRSQVLLVVEGNARTYRRVWKGSAVTAFLNPMLFLLAMGLGLGSLVDRGPGAEAIDVRYVSFIASGLLAATAMQTGASEGTWPVMAGIKWIKTFHAALATPTSMGDLVAGNLLWMIVRVALSGAAFALVAVVLGALSPLAALAALGPALLTGAAFAAPATAYTSVAKTETRLSTLFRFAIIPMFLFSGTFFPVEQLPSFLQPVAYVTPLWHGVELCRAAALGIPSGLPWFAHVAYLALWAGLGWLFAHRGLRKVLQP